VASKFAEFADAMDAGKKPDEVARDALKKHWRVIFNGNNYDEAMQDMLTKRGIWRIDSGVEAIAQISTPKNVKLFEKMGVLTELECKSRQDIMHSHYMGQIDIEAKCLVDMIQGHVIPSVKAAGVGPLSELEKAVTTLTAAITKIHAAGTPYEAAQLSRVLRLETMIDVRAICDAAEAVVPANLWTLATYKELLFLDSHTSIPSESPQFYDDE
jgi:glutamine synthetase